MTSTVASKTEVNIEQFCTQVVTLDQPVSFEESPYATAPMAAVLPTYQLPSEEELHSSFEKAISQRLMTTHSYITYLDDFASSETGPLAHSTRCSAPLISPLPAQTSYFLRSRRKMFALIALASLFLLIGFDLMGLLILCLR